MKVSVICPVYNGEKYLEQLVRKIRIQKKIAQIEIIMPVSKSKDKSREKAKALADISYEVKQFNHGRTRHDAAKKASGDYLVFITQDILPFNELWLFNLVKDLNEVTIASFSQQIAYSQHGLTEKLIREFNYPNLKRECNKKNAKANGRKNLFYSDASSAVIKNEFFNIGGYDFDVPTNEDVLFASNIVKHGKTFIYQPESKVWHSHKLSLKNTYKRYKDIGKFEKQFKNKIDLSGTNGEGKKLVIQISKELLKNYKIVELVLFGCDIVTRYFGYKLG